MYIRIDDSVNAGDKYISAKNGIGVHSDKETNCIIMQITTPYDINKGYGVAKCFIRGGM